MQTPKPLTPDDLPAESRALAEFLGMELFLKLTEEFGGEMLYIPNLGRARRERRDRRIRARYTGAPADVPRLSREYRLSERQIRNIVRRPPR